MAINCPDPAFPVEVRTYVLADGGFANSSKFGSPFWNFSGGWENQNGTVIGRAVRNGPNFFQTQDKFNFSFGSGDDEITSGELYLLRFILTEVSTVEEGGIRDDI